jgi:predicted MPP superfamily phosphohydrolase
MRGERTTRRSARLAFPSDAIVNWLNAAILALLIAGQVELIVAAVNRAHALPIRGRTLRHIRHLHDALLLLLPALTIWRLGLSGPRLLFDGNWSNVTAGWWIVLALSAVGTCGLVASIVRYWRSTPASLLESSESHLVDIASEAGAPLLGDGPYRWLARLPFNDAFEIDCATKVFRHPALPAAWDGLTILHLSDWHLTGTPSLAFYERAAELAASRHADLIVFTGDLVDRPELVKWLPATLGGFRAPLGCWFILGNHDWFDRPDTPRQALVDCGWRDASGRCETLEFRGHRLAIGGDETPWMGHPPDFSATTDAAFRLLLSHSPDHFARAQADRVDLMLAGHLHGGQIVLPVIGAVYSPSRYGCRYTGASYWSAPTLLHVSRGLAGLHPLRWRCRPELAWIVFRSQSGSD